MPEGNILVVEDDGSAAKMIMDVLESEGYAVFSASTKAVAVELAGKTNPDLVYINAILADASGLEITRAIRELDDLKDIPFVMLTEMQEEFNDRYKSTYGIVGFLKKPVDAQELLDKTKSIVPLEGDEVSGLEEDAFAEKDAGELAFESFQGEDEIVEDAEDRIKIKVGQKEGPGAETPISDEGEDHIIDTGGIEEPRAADDGIFSGMEEDAGGPAEQEHPLDNGFIQSTSYDEESESDMFGEPGDGTAQGAETPGETPDGKDASGAFEINGNADMDFGEDKIEGIGDADFGFGADGGLGDDMKLPEEKAFTDEAPKRGKRGGLPGDKGRKKKIDEMEFDSGGLDMGTSEPAGIDSFLDEEPKRGGKLKVILFGLLGVTVVAAGVWFGLDYFMGGSKVKRQQLPAPKAEVQDSKKGRAAEVREQMMKERESRETQTAVPSESTVTQDTAKEDVKAAPAEPRTEVAKAEPPKAQVPKREPAKVQPREPAPEKKTATAVTYKYAVQVGFFKDSSNARSLYDDMKKKGYNAYIKKDRYKGSTVYRVLIGKYNSRDAARRMINKIKRVENMDAALHNL